MVIISREPDGRWYVTLAVDAEPPQPLPRPAALWVYLGVHDFAVTSDGERVANPRHLERKARNLARYQRRLARCQRGSANRAKARAKVARPAARSATPAATSCTRPPPAWSAATAPIAIEDLNVSGMVRNRHLARAISDCGWGEFRRQLEYKCERCWPPAGR